MHWLPWRPTGDQLVAIPLDSTELHHWLAACAELELAGRRRMARRLLTTSPAILFWSLAAAVRAGNHIAIDEVAERLATGTFELASPARSQFNGTLIIGRRQKCFEQTSQAWHKSIRDANEDKNCPQCQGALADAVYALLGDVPTNIRTLIGQVIGATNLNGLLPDLTTLSSNPIVGHASHREPNEAEIWISFEWLEQLFQLVRRGVDQSSVLQREKLASLRQLAYGASHEINNPLANIASRAQILLADCSDPNQRRHLASIYHQAMRAHEMICDMMLFAHPPQPEKQSVDLVAAVSELAGQLDRELTPAGWVVSHQPTDLKIQVDVDPGMLTGMLRSIVQNAAESQGQGAVEIICHWDAARSLALIDICDDGPGISDDIRRHMFDPFYSGREAGRGLGFGLSKAWTIAQLHRGDIHVHSTSSSGTTIRVELPGSLKR